MQGLARRALTGSFSMATTTLAGFALRLVTTLLLARFLGPDTYGTYAQALVYASLVNVLHAFSLPQALIQLADLPGLVRTVRRLTTLVSLAIFALGLALTPLIDAWRGPDVALSFILLVAAQGVAAISLTYEQALHRAHRWHLSSILRLGANVLTVAVVLPLGALTASPLVLVLRDALAPILVVLALVLLARRAPPDATDRAPYHPETASAVWRLGRALFTNRALELILGKIDSLLVGEFLGKRELALYDQARYIAQLPSAALAPVATNVGLRLLSQLHDDPPRRAHTFALIQWAIPRLVFPFAIGAALAPELALRLLYGAAWLDAAPFLRMLALWVLLMPVATNHQVLLIALRAWRPLRLGFVWAIMLFALSAWPLGALFHGPGVAVAATLATLVTLLYWASATASPLAVTFQANLYASFPPVLVTGLGVVVGALFQELLPPSGLATLGAVVIALGVSSAALYAIEHRALRAQLAYLREVWGRRG